LRSAIKAATGWSVAAARASCPKLVAEFDVPHAGLDHPPRQQALAPEAVAGLAVADAVGLQRGGCLAGQVHHRRQLGLHAKREFVGLDHAVDLHVRRVPPGQIRVQ
jgi:hypothetical protein